MSNRSERPVKRMRRLISTDLEDSEGTDDWMPNAEKGQSSSISAPSNRPRRAAAQASTAATASALDRETDSPDESRAPTRLKLAPSKLRQAEERSSITVGGSARGKNTRDSLEGGEIVVGSRPRKKAIVEESSEEDDEDELAQDNDEDADGDGDEEEDPEGEDDEDAEGDDDIEMDDVPPARPAPAATVKVGGAGGLKTKPTVTITPAKEDKLPSVEDQEMAMDEDDDEELSELDSQEEDAEGEEEEVEGEEDAEGEDEEMEDEEDAEADSDDDETPGSMSRSHTPDLSKMTRRQRGELEGGLMALSNEAQKKKHLTAEEHAARRAEMARRRKNLSEKRNEEEKMDTINRLLKKQAPKRRGRREHQAEDGEDADSDDFRASSIYVRWTNTVEGSKVAVPEEFMADESVAGVFQGGTTGGKMTPFHGRMVEEVEVN